MEITVRIFFRLVVQMLWFLSWVLVSTVNSCSWKLGNKHEIDGVRKEKERLTAARWWRSSITNSFFCCLFLNSFSLLLVHIFWPVLQDYQLLTPRNTQIRAETIDPPLMMRALMSLACSWNFLYRFSQCLQGLCNWQSKIDHFFSTTLQMEYSLEQSPYGRCFYLVIVWMCF